MKTGLLPAEARPAQSQGHTMTRILYKTSIIVAVFGVATMIGFVMGMA